jgi:putative transposase
MAKRPNLKNDQWASKIDEWSQSGTSARTWCHDNKVGYRSFLAWRKRLQVQPKPKITSSFKAGFVELKNCPKSSPGIYLECEGIKIHLSSEFEADVLKKCLEVLRRRSC